MKKTYITLLLLAIAISMFSQYDIHHTQFMHNKLSLNPGYAGDRGVFSMTALYRNQWTGIEGAPKTYTIHAHTPFFNQRNAAGLTIVNDEIGKVNTTFVGLTYAYRMKLNDDTQLSIGIQGRVEHARINWAESDPLDLGDNFVPAALSSKTNPNFGAGAYLSHERYYVGVSIPTLLRTSIYDENPIVVASLNAQRSYYFMGGAVFRLNNNVKLAPAVLFTHNPSVPFEMDFNVNLIFLDRLWTGLSYRMGDSVDGLLMYQVNPQFKIGASVDYTLSKLQEFSPGSIEILLDYNFKFRGEKINNIRYF